MDLINRNEAIEAVDGKLGEFNANNKAVSILMHLPSVEPVRHGRWVEENPLDAPNCRLIKCSECGKSFIVPTNVPYADWIDGRNYCYGCGARMDGGEVDEV